MRWARAALLLTIAVALGALAPRARVGWLAARLVWETAHPEHPASFEALRAAPVVEVVGFAAGDTVGVADLYRPAGRGPRPAVLLLPPAEDLAGRGERASAFADALARVGLVVLVPDLRIAGSPRAPDSAGVVDAALERLARVPGVLPGRAGIVRVGLSGDLPARYAAAWDAVSTPFLRTRERPE
jgi:hypothetical protein